MKPARKAYWIARVTVTDTDAYAGYQALAPDAFSRYGARFLARGGETLTCEGRDWQRQLVIEFDSLEAARNCYHSPEYRTAREKRSRACHAEIFTVEGLDL